MMNFSLVGRLLPVLLLGIFSANAGASSFRVQCPEQTPMHPLVNSSGATNAGSGINVIKLLAAVP